MKFRFRLWRDQISTKFQCDPADHAYGGFRQRRKGGPKGDSARAKRVPIWLAVTGIILFTPLESPAFLTGFTSLAFAEEHSFEIIAKKFSYTPNIIRVKIGDKVKIRLISEDVTHGIFVDGYGAQTQAYPGQDGNLSFVANRPGRFTFRCSVTCGEFHPYMVGYLVVWPNARFYLYALVVLFIAGTNLFVISRKSLRDNL